MMIPVSYINLQLTSSLKMLQHQQFLDGNFTLIFYFREEKKMPDTCQDLFKKN